MEPIEPEEIPIFCVFCHFAVTVRYVPGDHQQNSWDCPRCGEPNPLPMQGEIVAVEARRLPH